MLRTLRTTGTALLLLALLGTAAFAQTKLVFWAGADDPGVQAVFDKYMAENPDVELSLEVVPYANYSQKIIAAARTDTLPDVLLLQPKVPVTFAELGVLAPVTDLVAELGGDGTFFQRDLDFNTLDGDVWGLPFYVYPHVLFYRADLLEAAGIDHAPTTWQEFRDDAKALTTGDLYGYGAFFNDPVAHTLHQWMAANDADTFDADLNIVFDSPNTVEVLTFLQDLWNDGVIPPGATTYNQGDARVGFANGQSAMMITSTSFLDVLRSEAPELLKELGVSPVPPNHGDATYYAFRSIGLPKDGPNQDAAEAFVTWLYEPENLATYFAEATLGYMPMSKGLLASDAFWELPNIAPYAHLIRPALEAASKGYMPGLNEVSNPYAGLFETQDVYRGTLMKVILDGEDPADAASEAAATMQEIMNR